MTARIFRHFALFLLILAGCDLESIPPRTTKAVTSNDIVGVWSFTEDQGSTTVLMTFMPSGAFTQQVVTVAQTNRQVGKWSLDGSHLELTNFLARAEGVWKPDTMDWYLVDGSRRLEIFGGSFHAPDSHQRLKYLRLPP